jgi:hypothetical protein
MIGGGSTVPRVLRLGRNATCWCVLIVAQIGVSAMTRLTARGSVVVVLGFVLVLGFVGWIEGL